METTRPARKKAPVNMRLVAEKAGVSATTVSLALRNDPSISRETKERIYTVQRALGYKVKERSRKPAGAQPRLEQLIYRVEGLWVEEKSYAPFLSGIIEECRSQRLKLELDHSGSEDVEHFLTHRDLTNSGVILSGRLDNQHIEQIQRVGVPYIVLGNYQFSDPVNMVAIDLTGVAEAIAQSLKEAGYESILMVVEDRKFNFEHRFLAALRGMLMEYGFPVHNEQVIEAGHQCISIAEANRQVVRLNQPRQAIITLSHCADALVMESNLLTKKPAHKADIFSVSSSTTGGSSRHYKTISLGHQEMAQFAVLRLADMVANPSLPPHTSMLDISHRIKEAFLEKTPS